MSEEKRTAPPAVGGSSLLVIFAVLAMCVFALLTLSTVLSRQRLSEAAQSVAAYYEADGTSEEIFARLRNGETVEGVSRSGDTYRYTCPVSERQRLHVELENRNGVWQVLRWQTVADPGEAGENTLTVWDGGINREEKP